MKKSIKKIELKAIENVTTIKGGDGGGVTILVLKEHGVGSAATAFP